MKLVLSIEAESKADVANLQRMIGAAFEKPVAYTPPFNEDDNGAGMPTTPQTSPQEISAPPVISNEMSDVEASAATPDQVTDINGVVWSADFHTSNKSKKADGSFKAKPGVDKDAKAAYETQFKTAPAPVADTPAADPIGLPGAETPAPVASTLLESLSAKIHMIAESEIACTHLDWTAESPTWKDMSPADAINALLRVSGLSQGFIDLPTQNEEQLKTIEMRIGMAWPTL